jgi:hypothetical protein
MIASLIGDLEWALTEEEACRLINGQATLTPIQFEEVWTWEAPCYYRVLPGIQYFAGSIKIEQRMQGSAISCLNNPTILGPDCHR